MAAWRDAGSSLLTALLLLAAVAAPLALFTWGLGVTLASPLGLTLGGLAVPLLLLYVLRPRRPRRTVGSLLLWRGVALDQQASHPFKRLRRNLVLLLQLLALAALAYGLARPVLQASARSGRARVIVLDTSLSMLTRDGGPPEGEERTRFAAAQERALELVRSLDQGEQATVIAADDRAWTVVPWTADRAALAQGIEGLRPRHVGTDLHLGFVLAATAALTAPAAAEVHLLSDGCAPSPPPVDLHGSLHYHALGREGGNLALTGLSLAPVEEDVETDDHAPGEAEQAPLYRAFFTVHNPDPRGREVFASLEREGRTLAARRLQVPPASSPTVVLEARLEPGLVSARLLDAEGRASPDALPEDDVAWALVPEVQGVPVTLVAAQPSPALERALLAGGARLTVAAPEQPLTGSPRLVVYEGWRPRTLPPVDCLLFAPQPPLERIGLGEVVLRPRVTHWDGRDEPTNPLRGAEVDLLDVEVREAQRLELSPQARSLVRGEDEAGEPLVLVAACEDGAALRVVVGFELYASRWPLRASFPIFISNLVQLAGERGAHDGLATGEPVRLSVPPGVAQVTVRGPEGEEHALTPVGGEAFFGGADRAGVYEVLHDAAEEPAALLCVNPEVPAEAAVTPRPTFELGDLRATAEGDRVQPREIGWWLALAALALLGVEAWAYHRRW